MILYTNAFEKNILRSSSPANIVFLAFLLVNAWHFSGATLKQLGIFASHFQAPLINLHSLKFRFLERTKPEVSKAK
ncbi:MAG: hypothetical protein GY941_26790 [Planctomycetes bacterium]|nr:hypothetical protein [Planctomycetota bacterium]